MILALLLAAARPTLAGVGAAGVAVPLHDLGFPCLDQRYPALAGPWVVACGPDGRVDRVLSLETGREHRLPASFAAPGLGPGMLLGVGADAAVVALREEGPVLLDLPRVRSPAVAPPATDGERGAMLLDGRVTTWPLAEASRTLKEADPVGWYPPALAEGVVAWVGDGGADGEDLWLLRTDVRRAEPELLAGGPGHQRHVVGSEHWLAWVEPGALVVLDLRDGSRRRLAADTGFSGPPTLWRDVACWETRPGAAPAPGAAQEDDGVDIECSDGLRAAGPGHQRWPSRYGAWLLYRQGDQPWLATAPEEDGEAG